ncbi:MAG: GDP-mannose 4,6-dehydratase [Desulfovibrionaceae bacterium]|nr:GDP-mannose 4,6-dehydratase [Desulfovibrionaceae bacterium]MBF0515154.1 GDP-mannose 4,6-dehydratase [Desulfovibrionaceae bacterium]
MHNLSTSEQEYFLKEQYSGRRALITGGLGFIGSSLAIKLVQLGCDVTVLDAMIPDYGGNTFNLAPIRDRIHINYSDITDPNSVNYLVRGKNYIFHCAGQVCHVMSLTDPFPDIAYNIKGTAVLMEACKHFNPTAKVIKTGTRGQYGPATQLPVNELAPTNPRGIYEISTLTAEKIMKVYNDVHGVKSVLLRLTNIYGPRSQMKHSRFGVVNWFVRLALENKNIQVFGDGSILRDFLYIDDCVQGILMAGATQVAEGEIFNVGDDKPTSFLELVKKIIELVGSGSWNFSDFTPERKAQEPGDYYSDISKIRQFVGWEPKIDLTEGLKRTLDYYRLNGHHYW